MTPPPHAGLLAPPKPLHAYDWDYNERDFYQLECLIVTHDNPALVELLRESFPSRRSAFLAVPQDRWDFSCSEQVDLIAEGVKYLPATNVLLVAHSKAPMPNPRRWSSPPAHGVPGAPRSPRQLKRERRDQALRVELHFSEQLEMLHGACVDNAPKGKSLRVEGVLYDAEADAFVAYDRRLGQFRCLKTGEVLA